MSACLLLCALFLAGPAFGQENQGDDWDPPPRTVEEAEPQTGYTPVLTGVDDPELQGVLEASSQLFALVERPPATLAGLERRAIDDIERLQTALRSEGYYAAELSYELAEAEGARTVTLEVEPGPRYRLQAYDVDYGDQAAPASQDRPGLGDIGIEPGMPARAPDIVAAERKLVSLLGERGYPLARVEDRKSLVSHEARQMTVRLTVSSGPLARFGPLSIEGLQEVEEDYVRQLIGWQEGEVYDRRKVDTTRRGLSGTGLFESVSITTAAQADAEGDLPVTLKLAESKHRSIGGSIGYSTDVGPNAEAFWEHRNIFGRNESLRISASGSFVEQIGEAEIRKPNFLEPEQELLGSLSGGDRNTEAFNQLFAEASLGIARPWQENWRLTAGVAPAYSNLDENDRDEERSLALLGLPLTAARDTRNDLLDPSSGSRFDVSLTPTVGFGSDQLNFLVASTGGAVYYGFGADDRFVLAGRARVGSIVGERTEAVPADRRFYAGGGGSIRGYEFQSVGPLDDDNEPLGGRALLELGGELRVRLTEDIGIVPFMDGGTVFDTPYPNENETIRWAAGLGLRYFTGFGPLRLDVALPLNRRNDTDDVFQFYISFGQAF